ncbi:MAG: LON peptidase substrate-binding domain-containing protein, partial [Candidatus Eisenbacteria bacterium]|nr:LON peptidase substrate-binding domain-containing protein [Candidatus Eisenbacteria bacterium]
MGFRRRPVLHAPKRPVPVFPLPGVVLFPHAVLPVHVFELRYRTMVRDALSGERQIVMTLLRPGWERDDPGSPDFHPIGCLARFEDVEWLPDDCYDLKLLGLARVQVGPVVREYPYCAARVELLPQEPYSEDDPLVQSERHLMLELFRGLGGESAAGGALPYEALVNAVCMALPADPLEKLQLLGLDSVLERGR